MRNIGEDVFDYDDIGSESDANDSESESDASYRLELDSGDNTNINGLEENISGSVNSGFDSSECTRKRPRIEERQVEATVPPHESYTAAASTDTVKLNRKGVRMLSWCLALHKTYSTFRSVVVT